MLDQFKNVFRRLRVTREDLERFDVALELADIQLQRLSSDDNLSPSAANLSVEQAREHRKKYELEGAWTTLKAARREMLYSSTTPELISEAHRACSEGSEKLGGWRRDVARNLLANVLTVQLDVIARLDEIERILKLPPPSETDEHMNGPDRVNRAAAAAGLSIDLDQSLVDTVTKVEDALGWPVSSADRRAEIEARVINAQQVLDEHSDNHYLKFRLLRKNVIRALVALTALLVILLLVVRAGWIPNGMASPVAPLADSKLLAVIMALGGLGGILSGAIEIRSGDRKLKIPELRTYYTLFWMRPLVGAAGAVVVLTVLQSDLIGAVEFSREGVLPIAIVAGFTERLVTKTVSSAVEAASE